MSHLLNLYAMTPPAMIFLFAVLFIVYGFLLWKIMGWYYGASFKRAAEEMRVQYLKCLEQERGKHRGEGWNK